MRCRAREIVVRACVQSGHLVVIFSAGAQYNDGQHGPLPHRPDDIHAVHVRQAQIKQYDVRIGPRGLGKSLAPGGSGQKGYAAALKRGGHKRADDLVVLHHQDTLGNALGVLFCRGGR